ncbi:MAG: dNTP triphosphohydrolase [Pirellulales bacterium]|nr:dNTP triphosphohydrolase [Pirellulales bacterium]
MPLSSASEPFIPGEIYVPSSAGNPRQRLAATPDVLAPYAMRDEHSRGREYAEPSHAYRGAFQRDRDRIVHCEAFRRLSDKTQVFTGEMGDYHRTRLTHTMEVALIARTLGRALRLNEDLIEALAYMHDIGHPPFGHSGEAALNECLADVGGFDHNSHALAIVEDIERRYPDFPGLNLSRELLDGQRNRIKGKQSVGRHPANKQTRKSPLLEVQVVDAADSTAYDAHDADDALELGLIRWEELLEIPLWAETTRDIGKRYANLSQRELGKAVVRGLIDRLVGDVLQNSSQALRKARPTSVSDVGDMPEMVGPSAELRGMKAELERFLYDRVYRHPKVLAVRETAQAQLQALFEHFSTHVDLLPMDHRQRIERIGQARAAGEYLACLTDRHTMRAFESRNRID